MTIPYICPLCQQPMETLMRKGRKHQLSCTKHQFDYAKEGYIHLLPVQHKKSKAPGDNKQMIQARRQFLRNGFYQPLQQKIVSLLQQHWPASDARTFADLGCGEGSYTEFITLAIKQDQQPLESHGIDISKEAIRFAAKKTSDIQYCVGSTRQLPWPSHVFDVATSVFAPYDLQEVARVLRPQGVFLVVSPATNHLAEIKQMIYDQVQPHQMKAYPDTWLVQTKERCTFKIQTTSIDIYLQLIGMTPLAWKFQPEHQVLLSKRIIQGDFKVTVDFYLDLLILNQEDS